MLKLGTVELKYPFMQSPLSGYSDYPMRTLAREFGCPLTFAGVMLAKSAAVPKVLRKSIFRPQDDEHPVGAQILGNKPKVMAKAAKDLRAAGYDIIDINFGCPVGKVIRRKRGAYLLTKPQQALEIYQAVRQAVDCPVTVKLRSGFDSTQAGWEDFIEICELLSAENVDALTIHTRTAEQQYTGDANWDIFKQLKSRFPETVIIASGDLFDAKKCFQLFQQSRVDGLAIARGAIGNPWLFSELRALFEGRELPAKPDLPEQGELILRHFNMLKELYGKRKSVRYFRKFLANYCKLRSERKKTLMRLITIKNCDELVFEISSCYGLV
jgi:nifR3 family TIM-barrel protein